MRDEHFATEEHRAIGMGGPAGWGEPHSRTIEWYAPRRGGAGFSALSGLEYLQGVISGNMPPPPISALAAIAIIRAEAGTVELRSVPDESWLNPNGQIHGGLLCTLMDSAMGLAVLSKARSVANQFTSIELKVSFLKPMPFDGRAISVQAHTLRVGRRVAFAEAQAHCPDGVLIGHATSSLAAVNSA